MLPAWAKRRALWLAVPLGVEACVIACGQSSAPSPPSDGGVDSGRHEAGPEASRSDAEAGADAGAVTPLAGFIEIEPVHFTLDGTSYVSEVGRLWYAFQPALRDPAHAPLLVFFNGGPGSATTENLFSGNTAALTEDPYFTDGAPIGPSPRPWNAIGNLLYIDARQTGFSYDVTGDPADGAVREAGFGPMNFSSAFDAADCVRLLLRFLHDHPAITKNPVIIVGESYGGVRATAMLYDLLFSSSLRAPSSAFVDPALADEIDKHFAALFPGHPGPAPPAVAAKQFGRQVLIEPILAGAAQFAKAAELMNQPGSPLYVLAAEIGKTYIPCDCGTECGTRHDCQRKFVEDAGRDPHDIEITMAAQNARQAAIEAALTTPGVLSQALGVDPTTIPLLPAKDRAGAYRVIYYGGDASGYEITPQTELRAALGQPAPWDWYLLADNPGVFFDSRMAADSRLPDWGAQFLTTLPYLKTFITHATLDVIVYPLGIPESLPGAYPSAVSSVTIDTKPRPGVPRPGWFTVNYAPGAFGGTTPIPPQTVRFPIYAKSGHRVASSEPVPFEEDVAAWLAEP